MSDDPLTILSGQHRVTEARGDASELLPEAEPHQAISRACFACNREFQPARSWHKFCSRRCRTRAWRLRKQTATLFYFGA